MSDAMPRAGYALQTYAPEETEALGRLLGQSIPLGSVIALRGQLGAGKTVFVRGIAQGLLAPEPIEVTSPTYVLLHVYRRDETAAPTLYHIDAYRLDGGGAAFEGAGLKECLADAQGLVCIEWPERVSEVLPADRLEVDLEHCAPAERRVRLMATGERSAKVVEALVLKAGSRSQLLSNMKVARSDGCAVDRGPGLS